MYRCTVEIEVVTIFRHNGPVLEKIIRDMLGPWCERAEVKDVTDMEAAHSGE
jgi:hypothetical protein